MKLLNGQETSSKLIELTSKHRNVAFAVAWASHHTKVFERFKKAKNKIKYGVIGTHFSQTHWEVLDWCIKNKPKIRFIFDDKANCVFHPKVYVFWSGNEWDILIGSANLTVGGMTNNTELMLHVTNRTTDSDSLKTSALEIVRSYYDRSRTVSKNLLDTYREQWKRRKILEEKERKVQSELLCWTWEEYYKEIRENSMIDDRKKALMLLHKAREIFLKDKPFHQLSSNTRRGLAGSHPPTEGEFAEIGIGWFGFTRAYGNFTEVIYDNVNGNQLQFLGEGLDHIPIEGVVYREDYLEYIKGLKQALKGKPHGLGVGARLLTIKRPDSFVPWNNEIKGTLEQKLKLKPKLKPHDYERYWDEVIVPIRESEWYDSPRPKRAHELDIWQCRVAMLDVLGWGENQDTRADGSNRHPQI
ncbi:MAG: NgoFVII family restriction endonuclease [Gammaproteobacteria bacterium]|nr:NgoFVII family restriction endonuclease [Gammaproteobacteria bacterium]